MNVSDILDLMADFSVGGSNVTDAEAATFLQYLNLAHFDLYSETALFNEAVSSVVPVNDAYDTKITLEGNPLLVSSVFNVGLKKELPKKTKADALKIYSTPAGSLQTGSPLVFAVTTRPADHAFDVFLYPVPTTANALITWTPEPLPFAANTQSYEIPYPSAFHQVLVDGGLWYVFQEANAFKDSRKAQESRARWLAGKQRLKTFLFNSAETDMEVYRNV